MTTTFSAEGVKEAEDGALWDEKKGEIQMECGNELEGYSRTLIRHLGKKGQKWLSQNSLIFLKN